jgi:hypothetical protein
MGVRFILRQGPSLAATPAWPLLDRLPAETRTLLDRLPAEILTPLDRLPAEILTPLGQLPAETLCVPKLERKSSAFGAAFPATWLQRNKCKHLVTVHAAVSAAA